MTPLEFWQLSPGEAGLILDDAIEAQNEAAKQSGGVTDEIRHRLDERRAKLRAKGVEVI